MVSFCKSIRVWLIVLLIVLIGVVSYGVGYMYYEVNCKEELKDKIAKYNEKAKDIKILDNKISNNNILDTIDDKSSEVVANNNGLIKSTTVFTTITIDRRNKTTDRDSNDAPLHFIGLSRIQLERYYDYYMNNKPTEEMEKGLLNIEIVSFNSDEVVINKIYDESTVVYYITENDGFIKVYYADKKTLYENTGILVKDLPSIERKNIQAGMFVKDKDELISILEGYSS